MFQMIENILFPALSCFLRREKRGLTLSCNRIR